MCESRGACTLARPPGGHLFHRQCSPMRLTPQYSSSLALGCVGHNTGCLGACLWQDGQSLASLHPPSPPQHHCLRVRQTSAAAAAVAQEEFYLILY